MNQKTFGFLLTLSFLSVGTLSPSFAEEIPGVDIRVTTAKSFVDSKEYFNFPPATPGGSSPGIKCEQARLTVPGAMEKEEAAKLAGEGKYSLAAEKMSEALDYYDKCGKAKQEKAAPRMLDSKITLDRDWLFMRAYFYQKCDKKDLAIADFDRLIDYDPYKKPRTTFAAVVELIRYKKYGLAAYSLRKTGWGDPDCHYLLGHCQEMQSKKFDALYNYDEAAQLYYINGEKAAMQASLEKVRALSPKNDPRRNIQESDLAPRVLNRDKIKTLLKYLITSENCFDATKLGDLIGTSPEEKLQMIVTTKSISGDLPNLLSIYFDKKHCTIFRSDLDPWLKGKTPLPQSKLDVHMNRVVYEIPSGYLALTWHLNKFKELESLEVSSKSADSGWEPKEFVDHSEYIGVGTYKGIYKDASKFPTANFFGEGTLKGPPLSTSRCPVRFVADMSTLPMSGSRWIIFVEDAVPVESAFETHAGARGLVRFTQANLMLLNNELERRRPN